MPYLVLIIGLIIGFYALYRFFLNANIAQIKAFVIAAVTFIVGVALLYLALTGKLIAALIGLAGAGPVLIGWARALKKSGDNPSNGEPKIVDAEIIEDEDEDAEGKN